MIHPTPPTPLIAPLNVSFTHAIRTRWLEPFVSPRSGVSVRSLRVGHDTRGEIRLHPAQHARPVPRAHPRRRARPGGGARSSLPPTPLPIALYTPGPHTPARAPCQPLSGVSVPRLRVVHDTSGEIRLNPTPRRRARPGMWSTLFVSIRTTARTLSEPFLIFGPQATRGGARNEEGDPRAPCPTTRGRFHRAPPTRARVTRGRSAPMFRRLENVLTSKPPFFAFWSF